METALIHVIQKFPYLGKGREHPFLKVIDSESENPYRRNNYHLGIWREKEIVPAKKRCLPVIKKNLNKSDLFAFYFTTGG